MKDNLSIVISMILLVVLVVIFPLYNHFERQDDMSYNVALKATSNFVDKVLNTGYIDQVTYDNYIDNLSTTGNIYDVQLEVHKKIFVKTLTSPVANPEYEEQYLIDYNDDIFSKVSGQALNEGTNGLQDKKLKDGSYLLNTGDKVYVKMKNSSSTMAGSIFNIIVPAAPKDRIVVNYGGVVKNNAWKKVDTVINTSIVTVNTSTPPADEKIFEYEFTGNEQSLKISFKGKYKLEVMGAQGGNGNGGNGGYTSGEITFNKNDQLYIYVGGSNGYNGGGTSGLPASTGGGATDIRFGGKALTNRIIVAGGGGGNGYHHNNINGVGGIGRWFNRWNRWNSLWFSWNWRNSKFSWSYNRKKHIWCHFGFTWYRW